MRPIQPILVIAFILAGILAYRMLHYTLMVRLFFIVQFILGVIFVIWPQTTQKLADLLNVGRGTDLILYLLVVFVFFSALCILVKFRQLEERQTAIIRALALKRAEAHGDLPLPASDGNDDDASSVDSQTK